MSKKYLFLTAFLLSVSSPSAVFAGPPFLTDDPEPVDYKHQELYLFSTADYTHDTKTVQVPAVEYNIGAAPNLQVHFIAPLTYDSQRDQFNSYGYGDMELGAKYRFIQESAYIPQVGIFPLAELDTGNPHEGLGNGKTWYKIPVWLQKTWGPWDTYGGGGYALNSAAGMRNYSYGGWLLQRNFGDHWTIGGEVFAQQASMENQKGFTLFDVGGSYNFTSNFSLLFTVGHTFTGQSNAVAYLGLYWTWGPKTLRLTDKRAGT